MNLPELCGCGIGARATAPMLSDVLADFSEFLYFPSIAWDHSWERQQTLISSFCAAHADREALVVAPTGLIDHAPWRISTLQKMLAWRSTAAKAAATATHVHNPVPGNLTYLTASFGRGTNGLFAALTLALNSQLRAAQKKQGRRLVLASYVNPLVERFLMTADLSILDLAERRQANLALSPAMRALEKHWAARASLLVADNAATLADYAGCRAHEGRRPGHLIPQGFVPPAQLPVKAQSRVAAYLGNLHGAVDYEYFETLILRNPDWIFKLCGQVMTADAQRLLALPNVRYQGVISNTQIAAFLTDASVGLIPYVRTEWTAGVFPTKLFEYLSHHVPVLSTSIPEVLRFADRRFVQISDEPTTLGPPNFSADELDEFVAPHTWDGRMQSYALAIAGAFE